MVIGIQTEWDCTVGDVSSLAYRLYCWWLQFTGLQSTNLSTLANGQNGPKSVVSYRYTVAVLTDSSLCQSAGFSAAESFNPLRHTCGTGHVTLNLQVMYHVKIIYKFYVCVCVWLGYVVTALCFNNTNILHYIILYLITYIYIYIYTYMADI
jgi:hypothetical protein